MISAMWLVTAGAAADDAPGDVADLVITDAKIWTGAQPSGAEPTGIAVVGDAIVAVGAHGWNASLNNAAESF
jgi:hypothetical protein